MPGPVAAAAAIAAAAAAATIWPFGFFHHHPTDQSAAIAQTLGGLSTCTQTRYEFIDRLDGTKTRIYSCAGNGATRCITKENGIVRDVTAEARLVFATSLSGKPGCL